MSLAAPSPRPSLPPALRSVLRSPWTLVGAGALGAAAVTQLPWRAADVWPGAAGVDEANLSGRLSSAFVAFWQSGSPAIGGDLAHVAAYWQAFHITKAVAAAALLGILVLLGVRIWQAFARAERPGMRWLLGTAGVLGAPLAPFVLVVLLANVQGAVAPLSSVLTFLPVDGSDPAVAQAVAQIGDGLRSGALPPALTALVDDFRTYHAVLAACALAAAVAIVVTSVVLLVLRARLPREQRSARRVLTTIACLIPAVALCLAVIALANYSTVEDTLPALAEFFSGSGL